MNRNMLLVDTERCPQQPLDKAASCVLTDRSLPYERASWQQCADCDEWSQETNIEYIFQCALSFTPGGSPIINFELKTRYPAYTCSCCRKTPTTPQRASAGGTHETDDEEIAQLCPLHVQAVYLLRGSRTANNMGAITKGFIFHCPDCGLQSQLLSTPAQIKSFIQQHISASSRCIKLQRAAASGAYDTAAAFGAAKYTGSVDPEKVIKELLSRLVVITACHIVVNTRPPPTPLEELKGDARRAAAATAHLRTTNRDQSSSEGQKLMPYRSWAIDALSIDSDLLAEANWVRPSMAGMNLKHKPSLLDMVLSPPYVAVAEHDAGMFVDKLAVLLLREQKGSWSRFAQLMAAAATGQQIPEAIAAVEAVLNEMLATDAVFQRFPQQQRLELFLGMAGIPGLSDVVYALAQPHFQVANPQNMRLKVCAVCGMSAMALKRAKRPTALHRCRYCIICTCQSCKHEQQQQHPDGNAAAAAHLCLWCQGHPDTQGLVLPKWCSSKVVAGSSKSRAGNQRYSLAEGFTDDEDDVTAGFWGQDLGPDASLDSGDSDWQQQRQQQQRKGKSKKRKASKDHGTSSAGTAAAAAAVALPSPAVVAAGFGHATSSAGAAAAAVALPSPAVAVAAGSDPTTSSAGTAAAAAAALLNAAAVVAAEYDEEDDIDRAADGSIYDLVVQLATAAVAAANASRLTDADGKQQVAAAAAATAAAAAPAAPSPVSAAETDIKLEPALSSNMLDKEMEYLSSMQLELQLAAEQLGLQGFNLPVLGQQQQQQPSDGIEIGLHTKRQLSPDTADRRDSDTRPDKRLCQQQQSKLQPAVSDVAAKPPLPPPAAAAAGSMKKRSSTPRSSGSPAPPAASTAASAAAEIVLGSGETDNFSSGCNSRQALSECGNLGDCSNTHWNSTACLTHKQQQADVLLTSAGFQPINSSSKDSDMSRTAVAVRKSAAAAAAAAAGQTAAAADQHDVGCNTNISAAKEAAAELQQELLQMLTVAGFNASSRDADVTAVCQHQTAAATPADEEFLMDEDGAAPDTAGTETATSSAQTTVETVAQLNCSS